MKPLKNEPFDRDSSVRRLRIILEKRDHEAILGSKSNKKLSWKETFAEMAKAKEDWNDLETAMSDGLNEF